MPQTTGCDSLLAHYTDFARTIIHSGRPANEFPTARFVHGARSIEVGLGAANGANRLLVFAGIADVDIPGGGPNQLLRGTVQIILDALTVNPADPNRQNQFVDFDFTASPVMYVDGNAYAGLAGFQNQGTNVQTTFAVDCVSLTPTLMQLRGNQRLFPVIRIAAATQGNGQFTWLLRIAFQANLQVLVGFDFQVAGPLGGFGPSATVVAGDPWVGRIHVPSPSPSGFSVTLTSLNPAFVPVSSTPPGAFTHVTVPPNSPVATFSSPPTLKFSQPPAEVSVPMVATLNGLTSTATINVKAHP
jgi:hypothetical protein